MILLNLHGRTNLQLNLHPRSEEILIGKIGITYRVKEQLKGLRSVVFIYPWSHNLCPAQAFPETIKEFLFERIESANKFKKALEAFSLIKDLPDWLK